MRMIQLIWELAHKEGETFAASEPQAHILKKRDNHNFIINFCLNFEDVRTTPSVMKRLLASDLRGLDDESLLTISKNS